MLAFLFYLTQVSQVYGEFDKDSIDTLIEEALEVSNQQIIVRQSLGYVTYIYFFYCVISQRMSDND